MKRCFKPFTSNRRLLSDVVKKKDAKWKILKIDRSGLTNFDDRPELMLPNNINSSKTSPSSSQRVAVVKEDLSVLGKEIRSLINLRGPITLHDFTSQAANHFLHGYYQNKTNTTKIGVKGDFVTAPEISQLFGEMITIWCVSMWQSLGEPSRIKIIELGPGNGTLMKDILRSSQSFPAFRKALSIGMVELSEYMRHQQQVKLGCEVVSTVSSELDKNAAADSNSDDVTSTAENVINLTTKDNIPISWYTNIKYIPIDNENPIPILFVGQEFLDAFPVHQLVKTSAGWREKLIDADNSLYSPYHFRVILSPNETPASRVYIPYYQKLARKHITKSSIKPHIFPNDSSSKILLNQHQKKEDGEQEILEISPMTLATCEQIANIINICKGACLFIDYGEFKTQSDSLRGFQKHQQVSILSNPGSVDVTADVDFFLCSQLLKQKNMNVYPLFTQNEFLLKMGMLQRVEMLLEKETTTEVEAEEIVSAFQKLLGEGSDEMGTRYKALVFMHKDLSLPALEAETNGAAV